MRAIPGPSNVLPGSARCGGTGPSIHGGHNRFLWSSPPPTSSPGVSPRRSPGCLQRCPAYQGCAMGGAEVDGFAVNRLIIQATCVSPRSTLPAVGRAVQAMSPSPITTLASPSSESSQAPDLLAQLVEQPAETTAVPHRDSIVRRLNFNDSVLVGDCQPPPPRMRSHVPGGPKHFGQVDQTVSGLEWQPHSSYRTLSSPPVLADACCSPRSPRCTASSQQLAAYSLHCPPYLSVTSALRRSKPRSCPASPSSSRSSVGHVLVQDTVSSMTLSPPSSPATKTPTSGSCGLSPAQSNIPIQVSVTVPRREFLDATVVGIPTSAAPSRCSTQCLIQAWEKGAIAKGQFNVQQATEPPVQTMDPSKGVRPVDECPGDGAAGVGADICHQSSSSRDEGLAKCSGQCKVHLSRRPSSCPSVDRGPEAQASQRKCLDDDVPGVRDEVTERRAWIAHGAEAGAGRSVPGSPRDRISNKTNSENVTMRRVWRLSDAVQSDALPGPRRRANTPRPHLSVSPADAAAGSALVRVAVNLRAPSDTLPDGTTQNLGRENSASSCIPRCTGASNIDTDCNGTVVQKVPPLVKLARDLTAAGSGCSSCLDSTQAVPPMTARRRKKTDPAMLHRALRTVREVELLVALKLQRRRAELEAVDAQLRLHWSINDDPTFYAASSDNPIDCKAAAKPVKDGPWLRGGSSACLP